MSGLRALAARLRGALRRGALDEQLDEEIRAHLEMQADEYVRQGMTPEDARFAALRRFGGIDQVKEECRDRRGVPLLESFVRDLRYGLRLLGRTPGFAAVAVVTLAVGIGSATTIFTVVNRALLRPLPVAQPDTLVSLNNAAPGRMLPTFSYPAYLDIRDRNTVFDDVLGYRWAPVSVSSGGVNERLWCYLVTGNYFEMLGVRAVRGRTIGEADDVDRGGHPVAVVSYKFWQQRLGGSPDALDRTIVVNGRRYAVIGVAPREFFGTEVVSAPDLWLPMAMQPEIESGSPRLDDRRSEPIFILARLKPDVTIEQAGAAMTAAALALEREYPDINEGRRITLTRPGLVGSAMRGPVLGFTALLLFISGLVLLLACVNLANLLLARAADRRREIAVRLSLGAGRLTLVRQLLAESVLLSGAAGVLGLVLTFWMVRLLAAIRLPVDVPLALELPVDYRVVVFNLGLSVATGIFFGLVPALQSTRTNLVADLKEGGAAGHPHDSRWKKALIVVQVAVSLVLLVGGGLMVRALARAQSIPLGFTPEGAVEVSFDLRLQGYDEGRGREFQERLLERVRALPAVRVAAIADMVPVDMHFARSRIYAEGAPETRDRAPVAFRSRVTPGYFQAMGTRLEEGRDFTAFDDGRSTPVAIVNRAAARRLWPSGNPIGRRLRVGSPDSEPLLVVGVAQDGKYAGFNESPQPFVYRPLRQSYSGSTTVVARTSGDAAQVLSSMQREVRAMDPAMPIGSARTLVDRLALPLFPARLTAWMLGVFGLLALALAAIGLYGVMSYMVASRTHEIGVRVALGARRPDVLGLVLRQGLTLTAVGLAAGLAGALALAPLMRALLYGVSSRDALTYASVVAVLGAVALVACLVPAQRATRMDPVEALRAD
jgi:predicted permease